MSHSSGRLFFLVGPTGSGKTILSIRACEEFSGEVLNCDSVQVYEKVNIGSARPSPEQLLRAKHHLLGHVKAPEKYTAGKYRRDSLLVLEKCFSSQVPSVFVTGGTGFYFLALEKGMFNVPEISESVSQDIQRQISEGLLPELYRELLSKDPDYAQKIGGNDSYRIQRALELIRTLGKTMGQIQRDFKEEPLPWPIRKIGLRVDRDVLRSRVRQRAQEMLKQGLIEEVQDLREQGLSQWAPMKSVGYKETQAYLEGRIQKTELVDEIVKNTMSFAKRQMTWFKRDKDICWFDSSQKMEKVLAYIGENDHE